MGVRFVQKELILTLSKKAFGHGCRQVQVMRVARWGKKFRYPEDLGEMCPSLVASLTGVVRALEHGDNISWKFKDTPITTTSRPIFFAWEN